MQPSLVCIFMAFNVLLVVFFPSLFLRQGLRELPVIWCRRETSEEPAGNSTTLLTTAYGTDLYYAKDSVNWLMENSVPITSKRVTTTKIEVKINAKYQFTFPSSSSWLSSFFFYYATVVGWVGWRNDSRNGQPVEIVFEFDTVRDFTSLSIFANNQFTKDVQVP